MTEDWIEADRLLNEFRSELVTLINDGFKAAELRKPLQSTIYHFTDVKGALGILQSGHFRFTERVHMNDPVEIRYGLDIAHQLFQEVANNEAGVIPAEAFTHLKGEHGFGLSYFGFWIACFSLHDDDLSQWRSYADDGRGMCLGFSTNGFDMGSFARSIPTVGNSLRFPMDYDRDVLLRRLQPYIDRAIRIYKTANLAARDSYHEPHGRALLFERDLFQTLNQGVYANALQFKHPAYKSEEEYRLCISGVRDAVSGCPYHRIRERNGEIVGYLELPIPNWKTAGILTSLRIGPAAPDVLEEQVRSAITSLGIPMPKVERSDIPYRPAR